MCDRSAALPLQKGAGAHEVLFEIGVIQAGPADGSAPARGMDEFPVAGVDANVEGLFPARGFKEDQVCGFKVVCGNPKAMGKLVKGFSGDLNSGSGMGEHHQP